MSTTTPNTQAQSSSETKVMPLRRQILLLESEVPYFQLHIAYKVLQPDGPEVLDINRLNEDIALNTRQFYQQHQKAARAIERFGPQLVIQLHQDPANESNDGSTQQINHAIEKLKKARPIKPMFRESASEWDLGKYFYSVLNWLTQNWNNQLFSKITIYKMFQDSKSHDNIFPKIRSWEPMYPLYHEKENFGCIVDTWEDIPTNNNHILRGELLCTVALLRQHLDYVDSEYYYSDRQQVLNPPRHIVIITITQQLQVRVVTSVLSQDAVLQVKTSNTLDFSSGRSLGKWTSDDLDSWRINLVKLIYEICTNKPPLRSSTHGPQAPEGSNATG
ncbi:hypothetical protein F5X99DRAFT_372835 [Biscogniauxia marginata]|nr:hypothetical protein F5X99DRAFT_372835 [Biscogniauxia marginata]